LSAFYSVNEFAKLLGCSAKLIYTRLTQRPQSYQIEFAQKIGSRWKFNKKKVDKAIKEGEIIIRKIPPWKVRPARKGIHFSQKDLEEVKHFSETRKYHGL